MSAQKKEKLLLENLIASRDVFSRCINIVKPGYFSEPQYRPVVTFLSEYFSKYNSLPTVDIINAEFDLDFITRELTLDQHRYTCDEIEKFCQENAFINAVRDSYDDIEKGNISSAYKKITDSMGVSLQKDLGIELYDDPEAYLRKLLDTEINYSTGINSLDNELNGGFARKTFTLFSANYGVVKSNMLANLGANYSMYGFNVLYISLELPEDMIYLRLSSIISRVNINLWKEKILEISSKLISKKNNGAGSYKVKRLPNGSTANDILSYLKHYELEYKRVPDVIIIDYLDLMHPNGGTKGKSVSEQDKEKSEEVNELLFLYNAIGISASQQNREALRLGAPDQAVIAGGITKVNTVHNYISLSMTPEMSIRGEMFAHFLKTRTSAGRGKTVMLCFDANTLVITDSKDQAQATPVIIERAKKNKSNSPVMQKVTSIIGEIQGMPTTKVSEAPLTEKELFINSINEEAEEINTTYNMNSEFENQDNKSSDIINPDSDDLLNLMNSF